MAATASTSRKIVVSLFLILLLIGGGAGIGAALFALRAEPPRRDLAAMPPLVEVMVVRAEDVVERFIGYGTARAIRSANLASEVSATVLERVDGIRAGSRVTEAQPLFRLDDRAYRHALTRAKALAAGQQAALDELDADQKGLDGLIATVEHELRVARDERARVADLFERDLAARKEYDFANLAYQQVLRIGQAYRREASAYAPRRAGILAAKRAFEAEAAIAQLDIERCEIRAPFAGRLESVAIEEGDHVASGTVAATLIDPSKVEVPIRLRMGVYAHTSVGATCRLFSESTPDVSWQGTVARIAPSADEQTRTFAAYVLVDNTAHLVPLVPGAFVRAEVFGPVHPGALLVPRSACRGGHVFVCEGGVARRRPVTQLRFVQEGVVVRGELSGGDQVILSHLDSLVDGALVRTNLSESVARNPSGSSRPKSTSASP